MSIRSELRGRIARLAHRVAPEALVLRWLVTRYRRAAHEAIEVFDAYRAPRGVAVDIGANRGVVTYLLASRFRQVHAFEPSPENGGFLRRNAPQNVIVHEVALSNSEGTATLSTPIWWGAASRTHGSLEKAFAGDQVEQKQVPMRPLDAFGLTDVALVKIDVEGHELGVLRGARRTLTEQRPVLWIEIERIHGDEHHPLRVFELLDELGYDGAFFFEGRWRALSEFDIDVHQPPSRGGNVSLTRVSDFRFTPRAGPRL